ncbi:glycosyltransferase [Klebsiella pneumoniae]|uniref:glycosyltransferase n=1 Tax=Klebsiella pneumoniae TaxID=573 RepID=UPI003B58E08D
MNNKPLVTIYIPTYNRLKLLKRALESALNQTYKNLEVIVVDDNSDDGTQDYLQDMQTKDSRVTFILKKENSGACISRNLAIDKASGLFITGLDDDDYFMSDRIECFISKSSFLDKYVFLYADFLTIVNNGGIKKVKYLSAILPEIITKKELLQKNIVGNQCFTYTHRLRDAGKFSPDMPAWQDIELFYRLLTYSNLNQAYRINKPLYYQDTSHEMARISLSRKSKLYRAFELFCEKNKLSHKDKTVLKAQLISYGIKIDYASLLHRFCSFTKLYFFLVNVFLLFKNFKNKNDVS